MASRSFSIFDIPLLKDEVTQYLSKSDLTQCIPVSREWQSYFTPILWRCLEFSKAITAEEYSGLLSNQSHVRSIRGLQLASEALPLSSHGEEEPERFDVDVEKAIEASTSSTVATQLPNNRPYSFPVLQSLHLVIGQEYSPVVDMTSLRLVESVPHLSSLSLDISIYQIHKNLVQTLKSLLHLQKLDIIGRYIPSVFIQDIAESCLNVDSLGLHFKCAYRNSVYHSEQYYHDSNIVEQFSSRLQDTRIRELSVQLSLAFDETAVLIPFLRKCPLLEKLTLERVRLPNTIKDIALVFADGKCPRLKYLEIGKADRSRRSAGYIAMMLQAIGHGNGGYGATFGVLSMDGTIINNNIAEDSDSDIPDDTFEDDSGSHNNGNVSGSILESLILDESVCFDQASATAITQYHSETLTHLTLPKIHITVLTGLMQELNRVKSVKATLWLENSLAYGADMALIFNKQWNCVAMDRLDLDVDGLTCKLMGVISPSWNGSLADRCMSFLISQVARLEELQELRLTCEFNLLTRDRGPGYLTRLSTLKKLEVLRLELPKKTVDLRSSIDTPLDTEEAEWMNEQWPNLRKVVYKEPVSVSSSVGFRADMTANGISIVGITTNNRKVGDSFMDTFLEKRPWLQIVREE
ncbi:hypothetical protein BGX27_007506 [Mortierella sp. AM989]|nr:hypothetical protein BGX27_007506 [Mortierella sp. AM989]